MKHKLLFWVFVISTSVAINSQTVNRVEVSGVVSSSTNDVEAITIFNKSANRGTITNTKGEFTIRAAENDIIEISALQFQTKVITITKEVIESKKLLISLVEVVNNLDAVLLRAGLSGNLALDISETKKPKKITLELGNVNALEFHDDRSMDNSVVSGALKSITNKGEFYGGIDFVAIASLFFKPKKKYKPAENKSETKTFSEVFSHTNIVETLNIPDDKVEAFINFIEEKNEINHLLEEGSEFLCLDYLIKQRDLFFKAQHE